MSAGSAEPLRLSGEAQRIERVLAQGRAWMAVLCLMALWADPDPPLHTGRLAALLFAAYVLYAVGLALVVHPEPRPSLVLVTHAVDVVLPLLVVEVTDRPSGVYLLFFTFALLAAAHRWGYRAAMLTAAACLGGLGVEHVLGMGAGGFSPGSGERLLVRMLYLLILAHLLGYLGEAARRVGRESRAIAAALLRIRPGTGLRTAVGAVFEELLAVTGAREVRLVVREAESDRAFTWVGQPGPQKAVEVADASEADRAALAWPVQGSAWHVARARRPLDLAIDPGGVRLSGPSGLSPAVLGAAGWTTLQGATYAPSAEWSGRLFLLDPAPRPGPDHGLRFLQRFVREVAPAVHNVLLLRRLRSRVGAVERARVARELHDGALQALVGLEMRLASLLRSAPPGLGTELSEVRDGLRAEVAALRELMDHLRPLDLDPRHLVDYLAEVVEKFRRETGIDARLVSDTVEPSLPPRLCREAVRIVQEALANVRRHSGARHVVVRLQAGAGAPTLVIDDDGRGFPFAGHLDQRELDAARKGPVVIKERVRAMGGELVIDSQPSRGARLEVRFPRRAHA